MTFLTHLVKLNQVYLKITTVDQSAVESKHYVTLQVIHIVTNRTEVRYMKTGNGGVSLTFKRGVTPKFGDNNHRNLITPLLLILNYLGGKGYDPEKADYSDFEAWLQCYYVDGMKSIRDHNGRTMWFKVSSAKITSFDIFHTGLCICQDINTHNSPLLTGRSGSHGTKRCVINSLHESENISWNRFSGGCTKLN